MKPAQIATNQALTSAKSPKTISRKPSKPKDGAPRPSRHKKPSTIDKNITAPQGESLLHYRTKERLWSELKDQSSLAIVKSCNSRNDPFAPALFPYWTCNQTKIEPNWLSGWNKAAMEYSVPSIGRFDLALVSETPKGPDIVNGILEVLVTSPMTDSKLTALKRKGIKWAEVQANVNFFRDDLTTPHAALRPSDSWKHEMPLPVIGSSDGPWICDACQQRKAEDIKFTHISAVVDVYYSATTYHGRGQIKRKVFGVFQKHTPRRWDKPTESAFTEFFFVEGSHLLTTTRLGMDILPLESRLLTSATVTESPPLEEQIKPSSRKRNSPLASPPRASCQDPSVESSEHNTSSSGGLSNSSQLRASPIASSASEIQPPTSSTALPRPLFKLFKEFMNRELESERKHDNGALIDVRLDFPGTDLESFFGRADQSFGSLVSVKGIKSIGKLHASLARIVGYRYRFHPDGHWIPSRNHDTL